MIRANYTAKYSCVKPEDIKLHNSLSFSFNPEEQPLFEKFYKMKLHNLKDWSERMVANFARLSYSNIEAVIEVSQKGRFHYHGWITVTKMPEFVIHDLAWLRHYGTYEIDIINDEDKWIEYVFKQERFMRSYCIRHEMQYEVESKDSNLIQNDFETILLSKNKQVKNQNIKVNSESVIKKEKV